MELLLTNQRVLMWLCLLPAKENTSKWKKRAYATIALAMILTDLAIFLASIMYMLKFMSIDTEGMFMYCMTSSPLRQWQIQLSRLLSFVKKYRQLLRNYLKSMENVSIFNFLTISYILCIESPSWRHFSTNEILNASGAYKTFQLQKW